MSDGAIESNSAKLPQWIQAKLFEDVLKSLYDDFEEIKEFKVENALAPGENYATIMLKVDINMKLKGDYKNKNGSCN